jgi:hypothetical protein
MAALIKTAALMVLVGCVDTKQIHEGVTSPATTSIPASPTPHAEATGPGGWDDPAPAAAGGKVGPGAACPVPLRFDLPARWRVQDASGIGLTTGDGLQLSCEIDGKPAGVAGTLLR